MVAPPVSNRRISNLFFWFLEAVELMACRHLASLLWRRHLLKAACLSRPYPDTRHVSKGIGMLLICEISISCDDFASERGAAVKTVAEEVLIHMGLGG